MRRITAKRIGGLSLAVVLAVGNPVGWTVLAEEVGTKQNTTETGGVTAQAEVTKKSGDFLWGNSVGNTDGSVGTPVLVNDKLYIIRNHELQKLNLKTGKLEGKAPLYQSALDTGVYNYITGGEGMVFVPLGNGQVQCFDAKSMESLFVTVLPSEGMQRITSLHYEAGMLYVGLTGETIGEEKPAGIVAAYKVPSQEASKPGQAVSAVWSSKPGSYHGGNTTTAGDYLVFPGEKESINIADKNTGEWKGNLKLQGDINGSIVNAEESLWLTTDAGKLYKVIAKEGGVLETVKEITLPMGNGNTPVIIDGRVIVTGGAKDRGFLAVYDKELGLLHKTEFDKMVNEPSVVMDGDEVLIYFTLNDGSGALYEARLTKDNQITVETFYKPEEEGTGADKVIVGEDGNIYIQNESGYLGAIEPEKNETPEPTPNPNPGPTPNPEPTPNPDPGPTPNPEPTPNPDPGPTPDPDPAPDPEPTPTPEGENHTGNQGSGNAGATVDTNTENNQVAVANPTTPSNSDVKAEEQKDEEEKVEEEIEKTTTQSIIELIRACAERGDKVVVVENVPEVIEAAVFAELANHPDMQMLLNCDGYMISIWGKDVVNKDGSLTTIFKKIDVLLPEEIRKAFGSYEVYEIAQVGAFPGKITVEYPISALFAATESIFCYDKETGVNGQPQQVTLGDGNMKFVLEKAGAYILSSEDVTKEQTEEPKEEEKEETKETSTSKKPLKISDKVKKALTYVLYGGGVFAVGISIVAVIQRYRRKKKWANRRRDYDKKE